MSLNPPHRSGLHRRRFVGGLLALVAFGAIAVAPMQSASASGPGQITVGARTCVKQLANPLDCPVGPVGSVTLTSDSQVPTVLDMSQATDTGDTLVWGIVGNVPLESYHLDTSNMAVVPGYEITGLVAA